MVQFYVYTGLTPLHLAAACGNPDCFKELVKAHADVNVQVSLYT